MVVISQPRYLPSCGYLHRAYLADLFIYLDIVQYTPRDWENRNRIKGPNGAQWLSVPVRYTSRDQRILDAQIDSRGWVHRHLRTLELNYRRAPYFEQVYRVVRPVFEKPWGKLWELNVALTGALLELLGWSVPWVCASEIDVGARKGQELLIALCHKAGARVYLSGPLGRNYIEPLRFRESGLGLVFHDYHSPVYPQLFGAFVPKLSAIDLLFNCGPESAARIVQGNMTSDEVVRLGQEGA